MPSSSDSRRSVPVPWRAIETEPQASQRVGHRLAMAAVMAGQQAVGAVHDERDVARRALPRPPARAAGQEVRPPAAVEQDDGLARVGQRLVGERVQGALRLAHVDDLDRRQRRAVDARGQAQARERVHRLRARRRAAGDEHGAGLRGAALGHAARVVARVALVLVGRVVLLVDDDEADVRASGRRSPSAARRTRAPPPRAAAPTRRGARRRRAWSAGRRRCRRSARRSAPRSAASARSRARARSRRGPARARPPPPAGRPRSCPSRSRRAAAAARRAARSRSRAARRPGRR